MTSSENFLVSERSQAYILRKQGFKVSHIREIMIKSKNLVIKWSVHGETEPLETHAYVILQFQAFCGCSIVKSGFIFLLKAFNPRDFLNTYENCIFYWYILSPLVSLVYFNIFISFITLDDNFDGLPLPSLQLNSQVSSQTDHFITQCFFK